MKSSIFSPNEGIELTGIAYKEQMHRKKMIEHLSTQGESTIPEISDLLNTSIPKANDLMMGLLKEGFIVESGVKTEGIGRKATSYSLNASSGYFLGVEIKKYKINIGLMGFDKKMVDSVLNIPFPFLDPHESLDEIVSMINRFLEKILVPKSKILSVGLSIAGRINVKKGEILTFYHFADSPVKKILEEAIGLPVFLDNDSRTIAYGEFHSSRRDKNDNIFIVNLDYGLGTGIFVDGKPLYGNSGFAGELGHIPLFNNEKICECGKKGCMQTEASGLALIDYLTKKMQQGSNSRLKKNLEKTGLLELEDIVDAVLHGDNLALEGVREIGFQLGKGLSVAINLFNPKEIIISGILSAVGDSLLLPVQSSILQYSLSLVNTDTKISMSTLNEKAGLIGCCMLVRDKILGLI